MRDIIANLKSNIESIGKTRICPKCKKKKCSVYKYDKKYYIKCDSCNMRHSTRSILMKKLFYQYSKLGWSLVPEKNKIPIKDITKEWQKTPHRNVSEWLEWIEKGYHIAVATGKISNITVIDIDDISKIDKKWINLAQTIQATRSKGHYHLFFLYDEELKTANYIKDLGFEVCGDGKKVSMFPSPVYKWLRFSNELCKMPSELKEIILSHQKNKSKVDLSPDVHNELLISEGGRTNTLLALGGVFAKFMTPKQINTSLRIINNNVCEIPLSHTEIHNIVHSIYGYANDDNEFLKNQIWEYLKMEDEAHSRDISLALEIKRGKVDYLLSKLLQEEKVMKIGRALYKVKVRVAWKSGVPEDTEKAFDFKIPYFDDYANFNSGDMIIIGTQPKVGKTTIAINILKQIQKQGKKPHYVYLEAGSRLAKIGKQLKLNFDNIKYWYEPDPMKIEIEKDAVTIIDWLYIKDKSVTDSFFKYLSEKLQANGGLLIVFVQLKEDGSWFAPNMVTQFPALAAKYNYTDDVGMEGYFDVSNIRDAKGQYRFLRIPCKYNFSTCELEEKGEDE